MLKFMNTCLAEELAKTVDLIRKKVYSLQFVGYRWFVDYWVSVILDIASNVSLKEELDRFYVDLCQP